MSQRSALGKCEQQQELASALASQESEQASSPRFSVHMQYRRPRPKGWYPKSYWMN